MLKFKGMFRWAFFLVCVVVGIGVLRSVVAISQKNGVLSERQQVLRDLVTKNSQLQQRLREATSPAFIEQAARDKLGLVKEGETVVIMDRTQNSELRTQENIKELPSWKQWWQLFF